MKRINLMRREENPQAKKITALIVNSRISQREQDMVVMEVEDTDLPMGFFWLGKIK